MLGWQAEGTCAQIGAGWWTEPDLAGRWATKSHREAKRICASCPVKSPCLEYALEVEGRERRARYGIWGGTTPEERHQMTKTLSVG